MTDDASPAPAQPPSPEEARLQKIEHFVVLMFENRSFDHLLGFMKKDNPDIAGLTGEESNPDSEEGVDTDIEVKVSRARSPSMPFDPIHEFENIQYQLNPNDGLEDMPAAPMKGFIYSAKESPPPTPEDAYRVMECFQPDQVPIISALAREFALFNYWHSSLPGPTFPNRFFVHAATSGGLAVSPAELEIAAGFSFESGTIYRRLKDAGKEWRIYHDGFPQSAAITQLRQDFLFTDRFRPMEKFYTDVEAQALPEYTFIEPDYDTGNSYKDGNSMHPEDDVRKGEDLLKKVYEKLRGSEYYWPRVMFIVVFDEHGGFFDHVYPPECVAPADGGNYSNPHNFGFDQLGVRVPAIVVSAYTMKGTVIGTDPDNLATRFDHTSILATVEKRFQLDPLTERDSNANTLAIALNLDDGRLTEGDALKVLPPGAGNDKFRELATPPEGTAKITKNQESMFYLAKACHLAITKDAATKNAIENRTAQGSTPKDAADYIRSVESAVNATKK